MREFDEVRSRIRSVLLNDWDPHNAIRSEAAHGTYDQYVDPLYDLLNTGAGEEAVMEWLHEREKETMCFPSLGVERLRRVARLLIRAVQ
ncbi:MAG: hypothetical protein ACAI43_17000 [Phycisphaerae bacterium]|nr:hypothetical protein [Tepidisphaeraceae bacterium]